MGLHDPVGPHVGATSIRWVLLHLWRSHVTLENVLYPFQNVHVCLDKSLVVLCVALVSRIDKIIGLFCKRAL